MWSIVAVHGLTGHAWKTFTATEDYREGSFIDRENNWLQTNLPRLLRQHQEQGIYSRVMTFGYDADVWMTKSAADLEVPVNNLVWSLSRYRKEVRNSAASVEKCLVRSHQIHRIKIALYSSLATA